MSRLPLFVLCLVLPALIYASKMCSDDEECAELGEVFCMKSRCNWGFCGCPRGKAMRWLGSRKRFRCVPINHIGEPCSTDDETGVCGAQNSECLHGRCTCDHDKDTASIKRWSYYGGEHCDTQLKSTDGETCSSSLGVCTLGTGSSCKGGSAWWNSFTDSPLDTLPNTCGCSTGQRVSLDNDFEVHAFTGSLRPRCISIKHGELCLRDADCPGALECISNKCACTTAGHKPDFTGMTCNLPRSKGAICSGPGLVGLGHCDGTQGLVCGDLCDVKNYANSSINKMCICDQSYSDGGSCTAASEGSSCDRDFQCRSWKTTSVCLDSTCVDSATAVYVSFVLMSALLVLTRLFHS